MAAPDVTAPAPEDSASESQVDSTELPTCPLCGDVEFLPIGVCEDFDRRTAGTFTLPLRCSRCGSVVFDPSPRAGASRFGGPMLPAGWRSASSELRIVARCCRADGVTSPLILVGPGDARLPKLRARFPRLQTIEGADSEALRRLASG